MGAYCLNVAGQMVTDIVIVNWNSGDDLGNCLATVYSSAKIENILGEVIVVDNASSDSSLDGAAEFPGVKVLRNTINRGFAAACNQGARQCRNSFILFLNPDVVLEKDSLESALNALSSPARQTVGILGIRLVDEGGKVWRSCARFPTPLMFFAKAVGANRLWPQQLSVIMAEWAHSESREVNHVIGAFFLVKRVLYDSIGGFDERFFVYLEDVDFSLRAKQHGFSSLYSVCATAMHRGGGASRKVKKTRLIYSLLSRLRYARKHFSRSGYIATWVVTLVVEPISRLLAVALTSPGEFKEVFWGIHGTWRGLFIPPWLDVHGR